MLKTPMAVINEFGRRNHIIPVYELTTQYVEAERPCKVYLCQLSFVGSNLNEMQVDAKGRSKREAKHAAAYEALKMIFFDNDDSNNLRLMFPKDNFDAEGIRLPFSESTNENFMWKLKLICTINLLPLPEYEDVKAEGNQTKIFTIACRVASLVEYGRAYSKKNARQYAADYMISKMMSIRGLTLRIEEKESTGTIKTEDGSEDCTKTKETESDESERTRWGPWLKDTNKYSKINISDYHNICSLDEEYFPLNYAVTKKSKDLENIEAIVDPKALIDEISELSSHKFVFQEMKSKSAYKCYVALKLLTPPMWVVIGEGNDVPEAEINASRQILKFLKDLAVNTDK